MTLGHVNFCQKIQTCRLRVLIVSLGALINHKHFQHVSSTSSWSIFEIDFTIGITREMRPKTKYPLKGTFL